MSDAPRLLINADDYGYFPEVSAGILDAARVGTLGATGIMATSPYLEQALPALAEVPTLDLGVHLNLSHGRPLSPGCAALLEPWGGQFPGKGPMARGILTGALPLATLITELGAQIERCLDHGLKLRFLNSHEHLHMLPGVCQAVLDLGRQYGIHQVRRVTAEWGGFNPLGWARALAISVVDWSQADHFSGREPQFVGLAPSGRLNLDYLQRLCARMRPGQTYELMCHPGRFPTSVADRLDPHIRAYHDWEGELGLLLSAELRSFLDDRGIRLVSYRDLLPDSHP